MVDGEWWVVDSSRGAFVPYGIVPRLPDRLETRLILCRSSNLLPQENVNSALSACGEIGKQPIRLVQARRH